MTSLSGLRAAGTLLLLLAGPFASAQSPGSVDTGFYPGAGFNGPVTRLVLQPNGNVVVGGTFFTYDGASRSYLARLRPDGSLDPNFAVASGPPVGSLVPQTDGGVLVGGDWNLAVTSLPALMIRVDTNGVRNGLFQTPFGVTDSRDSIQDIADLPDGKVMVAGRFQSINGVCRTNIARLNADGGSLTSADIPHFTLEVSPDLTEWFPFPGSLMLINGHLTVDEPDGTLQPRRFYRVIER